MDRQTEAAKQKVVPAVTARRASKREQFLERDLALQTTLARLRYKRIQISDIPEKLAQEKTRMLLAEQERIRRGGEPRLQITGSTAVRLFLTHG